MIIAVEAASTDLSVALADPAGAIVAEDAWSSERRQSAELFPRMLGLLERAGAGLDAITGIGVGSGPGSFTGLRVAMSLAKGLAVGLKRPMVAVPSLVAWLEAEPEAELAVARAGAREAYVHGRGADRVLTVDRDALTARLEDRTVVAPGELAQAFGIRLARSPRGAAAVARATARRLAEDPAGDDPRSVEPIYVRAPRGVSAEQEGEVRWL
jgi:tRNA threonylcarbamoyladenosine biosynthesis protein TsaB